ncbi:MAG TPA: hypothetical protein VFP06_04670, partial [Acidimicrobiales bacterium]|nr:hypothetical protein [Acidimicrobiales bacterium]
LGRRARARAADFDLADAVRRAEAIYRRAAGRPPDGDGDHAPGHDTTDTAGGDPADGDRGAGVAG